MIKPNYLPIVLILILTSGVACTSTQTTVSSPNSLSTTLPSTPTIIPIPTKNSSQRIEPSQTEIRITADHNNKTVLETNFMNIQIGETLLTATLVENSSVNALKEILAKGPITINMHDYGSMEKVGPLGINLPRNDQQITTEAGDIILFQGSAIVIYYAPNSWNFTRLGKIDNVSSQKLKEILGDGNVTITLSLLE